MKIKGIIFDLDGVIVDTARYHYASWRALANDLGFEFTLEQNENLKGVSREKSLDILLGIGGIKAEQPQKTKWAAEKNERYQAYISDISRSEILPGALELLEDCAENSIEIALGSASKNAVRILETLDLMSFFESIVDGTRVTKAKPDPQVFLLGAKELKLEPNECAVIEDSESGIIAANAAGMLSIGIGKVDILFEADYVYENLIGLTVKTIQDLESKA